MKFYVCTVVVIIVYKYVEDVLSRVVSTGCLNTFITYIQRGMCVKFPVLFL